MISQGAFDPINKLSLNNSKGDLAQYVEKYIDEFPDWEQADIVLIGLKSKQKGEGVRLIREAFYDLHAPNEAVSIVDLGDYHYLDYKSTDKESLDSILRTITSFGKCVILFGGDSIVGQSQSKAYKRQSIPINFIHIDSTLAQKEESRDDMLTMLEHYQEDIFQFVNLGYQRYLVSKNQLEIIKELGYQAIRYGELKDDLQEVEPWLRTADMVNFNISAIRQEASPASQNPSPGGFDAIEACQIARYAGLGYQLGSISFTGYAPVFDTRNQTAKLISLMMWYVIEGRYARKPDDPRADAAHLQKYNVQLNTSIQAIVFYCHRLNNRWWMEVPFPDTLGNSLHKDAMLVPCSEKDYKFALSNDIPDRWWRIYQKLN